MAVQFTYVPIQTITVLNSTTTQTGFGSVPSTYTDLIVVFNGALSTTGSIWAYLNNDVSSGLYSLTSVVGNGTSASTYRYSSQNALPIESANSVGTTKVNITTQLMNYSNTNVFKTVLSRFTNSSAGTEANVGLWRNTSSVSVIGFSTFSASTYFASGSTFTLYGIASA